MRECGHTDTANVRGGVGVVWARFESESEIKSKTEFGLKSGVGVGVDDACARGDENFLKRGSITAPNRCTTEEGNVPITAAYLNRRLYNDIRPSLNQGCRVIESRAKTEEIVKPRLFTGTYDECVSFAQSRKARRGCELGIIYNASGHLAPFVV